MVTTQAKRSQSVKGIDEGDEDELISFPAAGRMLSTSPQSVWRWFLDKKLGGRIIGSRGFTTRREIREFIQASTEERISAGQEQTVDHSPAVAQALADEGLL